MRDLLGLAFLVALVAGLATISFGPPLVWAARIRRWERAITDEPASWVGVLAGSSGRPRPTGPLLVRCGWPGKYGPGHLVAFDDGVLVVIRCGLYRLRTTCIDRADDPTIRLTGGRLEIASSGSAAAIDRGPRQAIAWYLAAAGWPLDAPVSDPPLLEQDRVLRNARWQVPSILRR